MTIELVPTGVELQSTPNLISIVDTRYWSPSACRVTWVASATVGTRILQLRYIDELQNLIMVLPLTPTLAAGQTRIFDLYAGAPTTAAFVNTSYATQSMSGTLIIGAGMAITVDDTADIDNEGDAYTIQAAYTTYDQVER